MNRLNHNYCTTTMVLCLFATACLMMPVSTMADTGQGFLYGRITTVGDDMYEGRLRFGGDEEAFWSESFNAAREGNAWAPHADPDKLTVSRESTFLGMSVGKREHRLNLDRPFMACFGDIERIDAEQRHFHVTLKSGTRVRLDRYEADDLADGVRVWQASGDVIDIGEWDIRSIEFQNTPPLAISSRRLYGSVQSRQGTFSGHIQWDREEGVSSDTLDGNSDNGPQQIRFGSISSITKSGDDRVLVMHHDGSELELHGTRNTGHGNRGLYVNDVRFGRVLVSWEAFERIDFGSMDSGPGFLSFSPGSSLTGQVITRDGRKLKGRLVYDLDESETTETLDAPSQGVDYSIPFGMLAAIDPLRGRVELHNGEVIELERKGDLGEENAGLLVFVNGNEKAEYLRWSQVSRIELSKPLSVTAASIQN